MECWKLTNSSAIARKRARLSDLSDERSARIRIIFYLDRFNREHGEKRSYQAAECHYALN